MALYKKRADLRAFLEIILSLSAITIFFVFALKPTALTIINLVKEIQEKRITIIALDLKIKNLQTAETILAQNEATLTDVDTAVSSHANVDVISKQIQGLAAKNSVAVLGFSVGQTLLVGTTTSTKKSFDYKSIPGNPGEMQISLSIKGAYSNIASFIKDFEDLRIAIKIDNLGINSSQTDSEKIIVVVISGRIPFLKK